MNQDFTVKFSRKARILEYEDPAGKIEFNFDVRPNHTKCLILEHYSPGYPRPPKYDDAFRRSKQFLDSCGYQVEVFGE